MAKKAWTINNMPDQSDRIVIVTGSNSGIGFEAAKELANKNGIVVIAVRNEEKGKRAIQRIKETNTHAKVELMIIDLSDQQSINKFTDEFRKRYDRLDLLINNAGVMIPPYSKTKDGFELQFGTNHLGHFALTGFLFDLLKKTKNSRIVNISSGAHRYGNINFDDLNWEKRKYRKWVAYGDSKIANLYFTYELQRKLEEHNYKILVTAAHPGVTTTELQRHSKLIDFFTPLVAMKSAQGALPTLRASTDPDVAGSDYFGPDGWMQMRGFPVKVRSNRLSHDETIAKRLWDVSEELTGVKYQF